MKAAKPTAVDWLLRGASLLVFLHSWVYYPLSQGLRGDFFSQLTHRDHSFGFNGWDGVGYGYGPVFALYELALRPLHDDAALRTMYVVNLALLGATFALLLKTFLPAPRSPREWSLAVFAFVNFYPLVQLVRQDNIEITELFFLSAFCWATMRRRETLSGAALGMAISTKVVPLVLVPWLLWRRRWAAAAVAFGVFVAMLLLVAAVKGFNPIDGLSIWRRASNPEWAVSWNNNQGLSGFFLRLFGTLEGQRDVTRPLVTDPRVPYLLWRLSTVALVAGCGALFVRRAGLWARPEPASAGLIEAAVVLAVGLLALPFCHTHYFGLLVWIFFIALGAARDGSLSRRDARWMVVAYALSGLLVPLRLFDPLARRLWPVSMLEISKLLSLPLLGVLIAFAALLAVHGRVSRPAAPIPADDQPPSRSSEATQRSAA